MLEMGMEAEGLGLSTPLFFATWDGIRAPRGWGPKRESAGRSTNV